MPKPSSAPLWQLLASGDFCFDGTQGTGLDEPTSLKRLQSLYDEQVAEYERQRTDLTAADRAWLAKVTSVGHLLADADDGNCNQVPVGPRRNKNSRAGYGAGNRRLSSKGGDAATAADCCSALALAIQEAPGLGLPHVRKLLDVAAKAKHHTRLLALDHLKDVFAAVYFPLLTDGQAGATGNEKRGQSGSRTLRKLLYLGQRPDYQDQRLLLRWLIEHGIKQAYFAYLQLLEPLITKSTIAHDRSLVCRLLFASAVINFAEQQPNVLALFVSRLGDSDKKLASRMLFYMERLIDSHPQHAPAIVQAVCARLLQLPAPTDSVSHERSLFYGITFISQLPLHRRSIGSGGFGAKGLLDSQADGCTQTIPDLVLQCYGVLFARHIVPGMLAFERQRRLLVKRNKRLALEEAQSRGRPDQSVFRAKNKKASKRAKEAAPHPTEKRTLDAQLEALQAKLVPRAAKPLLAGLNRVLSHASAGARSLDAVKAISGSLRELADRSGLAGSGLSATALLYELAQLHGGSEQLVGFCGHLGAQLKRYLAQGHHARPTHYALVRLLVRIGRDQRTRGRVLVATHVVKLLAHLALHVQDDTAVQAVTLVAIAEALREQPALRPVLTMPALDADDAESANGEGSGVCSAASDPECLPFSADYLMEKAPKTLYELVVLAEHPNALVSRLAACLLRQQFNHALFTERPWPVVSDSHQSQKQGEAELDVDYVDGVGMWRAPVFLQRRLKEHAADTERTTSLLRDVYPEWAFLETLRPAMEAGRRNAKDKKDREKKENKEESKEENKNDSADGGDITDGGDSTGGGDSLEDLLDERDVILDADADAASTKTCFADQTGYLDQIESDYEPDNEQRRALRKGVSTAQKRLSGERADPPKPKKTRSAKKTASKDSKSAGDAGQGRMDGPDFSISDGNESMDDDSFFAQAMDGLVEEASGDELLFDDQGQIKDCTDASSKKGRRNKSSGKSPKTVKKRTNSQSFI